MKKLAIFLFALSLTSFCLKAQVTIDNLRCEMLVDPLGH